jgi:excisionase family DNA binding protein
MDDKLLSTNEAAAILGVGTTSIKRWADDGVLACVRTAGGHRRYERSAVIALRGRPSTGLEAAETSAQAGVDVGGDWIERLVLGYGSQGVVAALEAERAARGSWLGVAEAMGQVVVDLGRRWEAGSLSVVQEHLASARLVRGLAICTESIPVRPGAPRVLLMTAANDDHTVGLHLVELVLRELGWMGRWLGRRAPLEQVVHFIEDGQAELIAVSASSYSTDRIGLEAQAEKLAKACSPRGLPLLLGGEGAWPEPPPYGSRLRTLAQLRQLGTELGAR